MYELFKIIPIDIIITFIIGVISSIILIISQYIFFEETQYKKNDIFIFIDIFLFIFDLLFNFEKLKYLSEQSNSGRKSLNAIIFCIIFSYLCVLYILIRFLLIISTL